MISSDDIAVITQSILSTMLQLEAIPTDSARETENAEKFTGCVQISGEWQGAVVLQTSEDLAKAFAARLLQADISDLSDADLRDAFAEMTNMIGGNIKGQVPCPSFLSIPSVTTGHDFSFHLSGANVIRDVMLNCENESLRVMMCEEDRTQPNRIAARA